MNLLHSDYKATVIIVGVWYIFVAVTSFITVTAAASWMIYVHYSGRWLEDINAFDA